MLFCLVAQSFAEVLVNFVLYLVGIPLLVTFWISIEYFTLVPKGICCSLCSQYVRVPTLSSSRGTWLRTVGSHQTPLLFHKNSPLTYLYRFLKIRFLTVTQGNTFLCVGKERIFVKTESLGLAPKWDSVTSRKFCTLRSKTSRSSTPGCSNMKLFMFSFNRFSSHVISLFVFSFPSRFVPYLCFSVPDCNEKILCVFE